MLFMNIRKKDTHRRATYPQLGYRTDRPEAQRPKSAQAKPPPPICPGTAKPPPPEPPSNRAGIEKKRCIGLPTCARMALKFPAKPANGVYLLVVFLLLLLLLLLFVPGQVQVHFNMEWF